MFGLDRYVLFSFFTVSCFFSSVSYSDSFTPLFVNGYSVTAQSGDAGRVLLINTSQSSCLVESGFQSGSFALLDHPTSATFVECHDISSNGVAAGTFTEISPFIIEAAVFTTSNVIELGFLSEPADPNDAESYAHGISDDGSIVVGESVTDQVAGGTEVNEAFMWTQQAGMIGLGHLDTLSGNPKRSVARGISSDGSIVVGHSYWVGGGPTDDRAFVWISSEGMVALPIISTGEESFALEVSDNGGVIVGQVGNRAVKWEYSDVTESYLGYQLGTSSQTNATAVSEDGTVVGGTTSFGSSVYVHTDDDGVVDVLEYLNGLSTPLANGWQLTSITGVSFNGSIATISGGGTNPSGFSQGWRATINLPIVTVVLGDLNLDGISTAADALILERYLLGEIGLNGEQAANADMNEDGIVDLGDLVVLERGILGL